MSKSNWQVVVMATLVKFGKKKKKKEGTEGVHQTTDKQQSCETILNSVKITVGPEQRWWGEHPPEKVNTTVSE